MSEKNDGAMPLGLKALCIDDNWDVLQFERAILEAAGYEVLIAISGDEGMRIAKSHRVDLVVVDCEMPAMGGTQVAQGLRVLRPTLPIIMVSGGGLPEDAAMIVDCFVPKTKLSTLVGEAERLTHRRKICAFCKLLIEDGQRPSVRLDDGEEVHAECYSEMTGQRPAASTQP
jgi:CheY-like chemotaxis protein